MRIGVKILSNFLLFGKNDVSLQSNSERLRLIKADGIEIIGVWRSWLAHLVWDQRVLCSSHSTPTKRRRQIDLPPSLFYISLTSSRFFGVYLQIEADCGEAVRIGSYFFI